MTVLYRRPLCQGMRGLFEARELPVNALADQWGHQDKHENVFSLFLHTLVKDGGKPVCHAVYWDCESPLWECVGSGLLPLTSICSSGNEASDATM